MIKKIPGIRFIQSSVPLEFNTDGVIKSIMPAGPGNNPLDTLFILTDLHYEFFNLKAIPEIKSYDTFSLPDDFYFPAIFDGTQNLADKKILFLMLTGWGDIILIEPVIRAFYNKNIISGSVPKITIAGNWINNFPYKQNPYIHHLCPNILTIRELREFDILVNFIPPHLQKFGNKSLMDLYRDILHIQIDGNKDNIPSLTPDDVRRENLQPVMNEIKNNTRKKLLCVNWLSRFGHKNADAHLFKEIISECSEYQAIAFNDKTNSDIIDREIEKLNMPIINLSGFISDFHDTIAALSLVDAFISVDTGIVHAAGALGIPGVALFGPFPPETHIFCYPSIIGMRANYRGEKCKGPCMETYRGCQEINYTTDAISPCFLAFFAKDILAALEKAVLKTIKNQNAAGEHQCAY